jgi:hypothetical protein
VVHYAVITIGETGYFYAPSPLLWFVLGFVALTQRGLNESKV